MKDNPRSNLKWLEQELLAEEEVFRNFPQGEYSEYDQDDSILELADMLLSDEEDVPVEVQSPRSRRRTKTDRVYQNRMPTFQDSSAVAVKTRRELRQEKKRQKREEKKAGVNRSLKGLVFLAILECIGILAIIGWWIQWLI